MLAAMSALWGTSFLLIKIATNGIDPLTFTFARLAIGAVTLAVIARAFGWRWPASKAAWGFAALLALAGQAAPVYVTGLAARWTTSADLALMMGAAPIATMLLARLLGMGEVWSLSAAFGLAVGLVGVVVAIGSPVDKLLLYFYHYDPLTGKYGLLVTRALRLAGVLTVLVMAGTIFWLSRSRKGSP